MTYFDLKKYQEIIDYCEKYGIVPLSEEEYLIDSQKFELILGEGEDLPDPKSSEFWYFCPSLCTSEGIQPIKNSSDLKKIMERT